MREIDERAYRRGVVKGTVTDLDGKRPKARQEPVGTPVPAARDYQAEFLEAVNGLRSDINAILARPDIVEALGSKIEAGLQAVQDREIKVVLQQPRPAKKKFEFTITDWTNNGRIKRFTAEEK